MLKNYSTKASPSMARKLIMYSQIKSIIIPEEMYELASNNIITSKQVEDAGCFPLDTKELDLVQYLCDFNGRSLIVTQNEHSACNSFLAFATISKKLPAVFVLPEVGRAGQLISGLRTKHPGLTFKFMVDVKGDDDISKVKFDVLFCSVHQFIKLKKFFFEKEFLSVIFVGFNQNSVNKHYSGEFRHFTSIEYDMFANLFAESVSYVFNINDQPVKRIQPIFHAEQNLITNRDQLFDNMIDAKYIEAVSDILLPGKFHKLLFDSKLRKKAKDSGYDLIQMYLLYLAGISTHLI